MRFAYIHAEKAAFAITDLCRVLDVTRGGYYAFVNRGVSTQEAANEELERAVQSTYEVSRGTYGSPRIHQALRRQGVRVGRSRVERAMRKLGIAGRRPRAFRRTTVADPSHPKAENVLNRRFKASRPDEVWVTDITYIRTEAGWAFLAAIIDLHSRAVVGWALDSDVSTKLPLQALDMALRHRRPEVPPLHHSDRGCQYTSAAYRAALNEAGMTASMSRTGNCWDNAVAESFFATLKLELIYGKTWRDLVELRAALFDYIHVFYNRQRIHSTLGYRTPAEVQDNPNAALAA